MKNTIKILLFLLLLMEFIAKGQASSSFGVLAGTGFPLQINDEFDAGKNLKGVELKMPYFFGVYWNLQNNINLSEDLKVKYIDYRQTLSDFNGNAVTTNSYSYLSVLPSFSYKFYSNFSFGMGLDVKFLLNKNTIWTNASNNLFAITPSLNYEIKKIKFLLSYNKELKPFDTNSFGEYYCDGILFSLKFRIK